MATSTTELILKFTGDPSSLKSTMAQVRAELSQTAKTQVSSASTANKQITSEAKTTTATLTKEERERVKAAEALQRQRSAAIIAIWKAEIREAKSVADAKIREEARVTRESIALYHKRAAEQSKAARLALGGTSAGTSASSLTLAGAAGGVAALVGLSAASEIRQAASAWFEYSSKLEATKIAFTTMLGSAQAATAHLKELQAFAIRTPFEFSDLVAASQRMQALGIEAKDVVPLLNDVGNAVAAAGGGAERLDRVILALAQMQSKGRVATQELNQLAEAGISGFKILEQATGKSRAALVKLVEQGQITSDVFITAFRQFSQANFGGLMEQQSKTAIGALSNIKDAVLQLADEAFKPLFESVTRGLLAMAGHLATNQGSWKTWGQKVSSDIALAAESVSVLISKFIELDKKVAESIGLDRLARQVEESGPDLLGTIAQQSIITAATLRALFPSAFPGTVTGDKDFKPGLLRPGEFGVPEKGKKIELPESKDKKDSQFQADLEAANAKARQELERQRHLGEQLKNTFDENRATLEQFFKGRQTLIDEHFNTLTRQIEREETALTEARARGIIKAEEASKKEDDLALRTTQVRNKKDEETRKLKIEKQRAFDKLDNDRANQLFSLAQTRRDIELSRIKDHHDRGLLTESEALTAQLRIFQETHEERQAIIATEFARVSTTAERKIQIDNELIESQRRYTAEVEKLSQARTDALAREAAARGPQFKEGTGHPSVDKLNPNAPKPPVLFEPGQNVFDDIQKGMEKTLGISNELAAGITDVLAQSFSQLAQGVGDAVRSFILFGKVEGGFRKFAAEMIASIAAMAAVQAVFQLAQALAWTALFAFFPNPEYAKAASLAFASAAVFGSIAGVAAVAGRAMAGNNFNQSGSGGGGGSSSGGGSGGNRNGQGDLAPIDINRNVSRQPITLQVAVTVKRDEGSIVDVMVQNVRKNGEFRQTMQEEFAR